MYAYSFGWFGKEEIKTKSRDINSLSPKELESKLRETLDFLGYKTGSSPNPDAIFQFIVTDINGINANIGQPKSSPATLSILMNIKLPQDLQQKIMKLKEKDRIRLTRELRRTIDRQGILRTSSFLPLTTITLEDAFLKEDLQNLSMFIQKVRNMFLMYYSVLDVILSFTEE